MLTQVESGPIVSATATIASGASLSGAVDTAMARLACIIMPAAWSAGVLTFQVSADNSTWVNLYNADGTEYSVAAAAASRGIIIPMADFLGVRYLKVRSGTSGTPVNQGADRAITLNLAA